MLHADWLQDADLSELHDSHRSALDRSLLPQLGSNAW